MTSDLEETRLPRLVAAAIRRYLMMFGMFLLPFSSLRVFVMRLCGVRIGKGCYVGFNVVFDTNFPALISIGNWVTISHNVAIYTRTATPAAGRLAGIYHSTARVTIGDGAWISANSVILPGVEIGADCMIGAGAVVTRSTDACSLYAGNPARKIRLDQFRGWLLMSRNVAIVGSGFAAWGAAIALAGNDDVCIHVLDIGLTRAEGALANRPVANAKKGEDSYFCYGPTTIALPFGSNPNACVQAMPWGATARCTAERSSTRRIVIWPIGLWTACRGRKTTPQCWRGCRYFMNRIPSTPSSRQFPTSRTCRRTGRQGATCP